LKFAIVLGLAFLMSCGLESERQRQRAADVPHRGEEASNAVPPAKEPLGDSYSELSSIPGPEMTDTSLETGTVIGNEQISPPRRFKSCADALSVTGDFVLSSRVVTDRSSRCFAYHHQMIELPSKEPAGAVRISPTDQLHFVLGRGEDFIFLEYKGRRFGPSQTADLISQLQPGENTVDFLVVGEGEVHYWDIAFTINDTPFFSLTQPRLLPCSCEDEMYRYRFKILLVFSA